MIGGLCAGFWLINKIIICLSRIFDSNIFMEKLLFGGAAIGSGLFLIPIILAELINWTKIYATFKIFPLTISVSQKAIEFADRKGKYTLPIPSITHILSRKNRIILVWNVNEAPVTFTFLKNDFGNEALSKLKECFKELEQYTDELSRINPIWKELKLDNIFRGNRYEYLIGKIHN